MPIQCCQTLAEFMANADYCTDEENCGIHYNPGKNMGDTLNFVYCPFCGIKVGHKQMDEKTLEELKQKHPLIASLFFKERL